MKPNSANQHRTADEIRHTAKSGRVRRRAIDGSDIAPTPQKDGRKEVRPTIAQGRGKLYEQRYQQRSRQCTSRAYRYTDIQDTDHGSKTTAQPTNSTKRRSTRKPKAINAAVDTISGGWAGRKSRTTTRDGSRTANRPVDATAASTTAK